MKSNEWLNTPLNHIKIMGVTTVVVLVGLAWLYGNSPISAKLYRGDFRRQFTNISSWPDQKVNLGYNSFYISGANSSQLFLGNYSNPHIIGTINRKTLELLVKTIDAPSVDSIQDPGYFRLAIRGNHFYLSHGVKPIIIKGSLDDLQGKPLRLDNNDYFDQAVPLNESSFGLRFFSKSKRSYAIGKKETWKRDSSFKSNSDLLTQQQDGVFSVDGKLIFDDSVKRLVYVYAYRNQFIVADTNLVIQGTGNTIDQIAEAQIRVSKLSDNESMLASPGALVNRNSSVYNDILYIESNIMGQDESEDTFKSSSVVDIYSISERKYLRSLLLKNPKSTKLNDFHVIDHKLFAISDDNLLVYSIRPN